MHQLPIVRGMQSFGQMVYALLDNGSALTLERAFPRRHFSLSSSSGEVFQLQCPGFWHWVVGVSKTVVPLEQGLLGLRRQNQTQKQDCKEKLRTLDFIPQVALVSSSCSTCSSPGTFVLSTLRGFQEMCAFNLG